MENEVIVQRSAMQDGEELGIFANKIVRAVHENASVFGVEPGNLVVVGIYRETIVAKDFEKNRHVRVNFEREGDTFSFANAVVVVPSWRVVGELDEEPVLRSEDEEVCVDLTKKPFWQGVL